MKSKSMQVECSRIEVAVHTHPSEWHGVIRLKRMLTIAVALSLVLGACQGAQEVPETLGTGRSFAGAASDGETFVAVIQAEQRLVVYDSR